MDSKNNPQNSTNSTGESGNTKQTPAKKMWCFTLNNYSDSEYEAIIQFLDNSTGCKYVIGKEVGKETKTPHIQGYVNFAKRVRLTALKKLNNRIHWESCKGSEEQNIKYCTKEGNFKANIKIKKPLKILNENQLYEWQKEIIDIVKKEPDDRTIYWLWEKTGGVGKTTFCKYLSHMYGAVPVEGKKSDILFCVAEHESDIYVFDFERSMQDIVPYGAIEKVKNGYFMCGKYESKPVVRNSPHVFCFANFAPDLGMLSKDRWKVVEIAKKK